MKFPYLVQKKLKPGQEIRRVAQLEWKNVESDLKKPFVASGLQFVPLPVSFDLFFFCSKYTIVLSEDISYSFLVYSIFMLFLGDAW